MQTSVLVALLVHRQQFLDSEMLRYLVGYLLDYVFDRLLDDRLQICDQLLGVFIQSSICGVTCEGQENCSVLH